MRHEIIRYPSLIIAVLTMASVAPRVAVAGDAPPNEVVASGMLQTWGTIFDQDENPQADPAGYGDPEDDPGFAINRARIGLGGQQGKLGWQLTMGYGRPFDAVMPVGIGSSFGLIDANGSYRFDIGKGAITAAVGIQRLPFGRENQISAGELVFQERGVNANWLSPVREVGALGEWNSGFGLKVTAGVFNGNGDFEGDDNIGKMVVGRVEYAKGDAYRTYGATSEKVFGIAVDALQNADVSTGTLTLGVDALARIQGFTLMVDAAQAKLTPRNTDIAPPEVLDGTTRLGFAAQLSWFAQTSASDASVLSGIETAVRFATYDADTDQSDNGDVGILHAGATWRQVTPGLDVGAAYIHRQEFGGRAISNDTVRLTAQLRAKQRITPKAAVEAQELAWRKDFVGTWTAGGDLDGAILALWEQPGLGLVGSFQMTKPRGQVVVGRPYPLDSFMYADRTLRVRLDPYGEGRDVVWFELSPSQDGQLCGYGYEDARRSDAVNGTGGGSWVCWSPASK